MPSADVFPWPVSGPCPLLSIALFLMALRVLSSEESFGRISLNGGFFFRVKLEPWGLGGKATEVREGLFSSCHRETLCHQRGIAEDLN